MKPGHWEFFSGSQSGSSTPHGPSQGQSRAGHSSPRPAGHSSLGAAQTAVGLLGCKRTLLAHAELFLHQNPQFSLSELLSASPSPTLPVLMPGITLTQLQHGPKADP